jgi:transcriptional regulator with XRE-family HTH domain
LRLTCEIPSKKPILWETGKHSLAEVLRKTRLEKGLLQREASEIIGCDKASYYNWEKERSGPVIEYSRNVRKFLGRNAQFLDESLREFKEDYLTIDELCRKLPMNKNTLESFVRRTLKMNTPKNLSGKVWLFFRKEVVFIKEEMKRRKFKPRKAIKFV